MKLIIPILLLFTATTYAVPVDLGPDRYSSYESLTVRNFQRGTVEGRQVRTLEFNKPIRVTSSSGTTITFNMFVSWLAPFYDIYSSPRVYDIDYLNAKGDWMPIAFDDWNGGIGPYIFDFSTRWEHPVSIYGFKFDFKLAKAYYAGAILVCGTGGKPFHIGENKSVPDWGNSALLFLVSLSCLALKRLV